VDRFIAESARGMVAELSRAKRLIAASYSHGSADYARYAGDLVYTHLAKPLVDAIESFGGPSLDVAGGTGALTRHMTDAVVADIAYSQLINNAASRRVQCDAEQLPFADDSFAVAASAFGVNHFPDVDRAVREMARVAPVVGLMTWVRPEEKSYPPKVAVLDAIARHSGVAKTEAGALVDEMSEAVGSVEAVERLFEGAGLKFEVGEVIVTIPWPGTEGFIDYRLSMMGPGQTIEDIDALKKEATAAIEAMSEAERRWDARLVLGVGRR
jgi:SAM-dependent methyltransferase